MVRSYRWMLSASMASMLASCILPPFDPDGRPCPCVDGWSCVAGVCVEGAIDGGSADGGMNDARTDAPSVDAGSDAADGGPICEAAAAPACLADGRICGDGTIASSVCVDAALYFCVGGALQTATCPGACSADGLHCDWAPRYLTHALESDAAATLSAESEPIWLLDTDDGTIRRFATLADVDVPGGGRVDTESGLAFDFIDHAYYARVVHFETGVTVLGTGGHALTLIALDEISVEAGALISVSARGALAGPAGFDGADGSDGSGRLGVLGGGQSCTSTTAHREGGGGGSHGTSGGASGDGGDGDMLSAAPGPLQAFVPDELTGGFGGGGGCLNSAGGAGGGALYLFARTAIRIDGALLSGGGGGEGGAIYDGGGGAGSGGTIVVEAPVIELRGEIHVPGGSGGEGSGGPSIPAGSPTLAGADGTDGDASGAPARTPTTSDGNGDGGSGSDATGFAEPGGGVTATPPPPANRAGGGGGGAGVVVIIRAPPATADGLRDRVVPGVDGTFFELPPMAP